MISFVVQGPITRWTDESCKSIRRFFPGSEIILSTWKGHKFENLDCDRVVVSNHDPGKNSICGSVFQQLTTTLAGVKVASFDLVCKVRSDSFFISNDILSYWEKYDHFTEDLRIVEKKLLVPMVGSLHPKKICRMFHPSDFFIFGKKQDVLFWYDIPLVHYEGVKVIAPEQFIAISALRKKYPEIRINDINEQNDVMREKTYIMFANNFVVLENWSQYGLISKKYETLCAGNETAFDDWNRYWFNVYVRHAEWQQMYQMIGGRS